MRSIHAAQVALKQAHAIYSSHQSDTALNLRAELRRRVISQAGREMHAHTPEFHPVRGCWAKDPKRDGLHF